MGSFGRCGRREQLGERVHFYVSHVGINIHKSERRFSAPLELQVIDDGQ